jgi:hypothetical protein
MGEIFENKRTLCGLNGHNQKPHEMASHDDGFVSPQLSLPCQIPRGERQDPERHMDRKNEYGACKRNASKHPLDGHVDAATSQVKSA